MRFQSAEIAFSLTSELHIQRRHRHILKICHFKLLDALDPFHSPTLLVSLPQETIYIIVYFLDMFDWKKTTTKSDTKKDYSKGWYIKNNYNLK